MLLLASLLLPARADSDAAASSARVRWHLWSWTGVEAAPSYAAETEVRAEQQLALDLSSPTGWQLEAIGALRDPAALDAALTGDLYRARVSWRGQLYSFELGRLVLLGSRGLERLDGLSVQAGQSDRLRAILWGGRLWQPETWQPGDTFVGGGELRSNLSSTAAAGAGYEARLTDTHLEHRVHAFGSLRDLRGGQGAVMGELAPLEEPLAGTLPPARLELSGRSPAGHRVDLGAAARWEGLTPATQPEALSAPMEWLAGAGYAALDLDLGVQLGAVRLSGTASPTWRTAATGNPLLGAEDVGGAGAIGRASAAWQANHALWLGVAAVGAQAHPSWVAGGVGEVRAELPVVELEADAGWFRFQPQTGPMAAVFEGRLAAEADLPLAARGSFQGLSLLGEIAGGADRLLDPWLRGGLVLRGELGNRGGALP